MVWLIMPRPIKHQRLLQLIGQGMPLSLTPFRQLAQQAGITEKEVISQIRRWQKQGIIRKLGIFLAHTSVGYKTNALVVWQIPAARINRVGSYFASLPEITHCYQRKTYPQWKYNLYTMLHAKNKTRCQQLINQLAAKIHVKEYQVLYSLQELKKAPLDLNQILD